MVDYTKQILKGTTILFVFTIISSFLGYFIRMILTRKLTVEEYGLFYAILTLIIFLRIFRDLGISNSLTKFIPEFNTRQKYEKVKSIIIYVFGFNIIIVSIITLILLGFSNFLTNNYFKNPLAFTILLILILYFWFDAFVQTLRGTLLAFKKFYLYSFGDFGLNMIILSSILLFKGNLMMILAWSYVGATLFLIFFYLFFIQSIFNLSKYKILWSKKLFKKIFYFSLPVLFSGMSYILIGYTDTIMLTYFSLKQVGIYNAVLPTALLLLIIGRSIASIIFPVSSEMWAKKESNLLGIIVMKINRYIFLIILPFGLLLISFPALFLKILFGNEYVQGTLALQILVFGSIIYNVALVNNSILSAIGKPKITLRIILIAALLNIILNASLIPSFGINGAAFASAVSYGFILIVSTIKLSHYIKFKLPWLSWIKLFLLSIILLNVVAFLKTILNLNSLVEIFVCLAITFLIYILLTTLLKLWNYKELKELLNLLIKSK